MGSNADVTLDDVRSLVADLATAMYGYGAVSAGDILREVNDHPHEAAQEELLELRSALVRTRAEWELVEDPELLTEARRVLAAAKRLAIELKPAQPGDGSGAAA